MATEKLCLKDYLSCVDDKKLSKTRKKVNKKSHTGRYYGLDHGYDGASMAGGDGGGAVGESVEQVNEMHDGAMPGSWTATIMSRMPDGTTSGTEDMKKQNRRNAPRKRSFADFLRQRNQAEEEEWSDNEPENEFDYLDRNADRDPEYDQFRDEFEDDEQMTPELRRAMGLPGEDEPELDAESDGDYDFIRQLRDVGSQNYGIEGGTEVQDNDYEAMLDGPENEEEFEGDPDEFDEIDPEEELDFDADSEMSDDDGIDDEDIEEIDRITGRFVDFYRDDQTDHGSSYPEIDGEQPDSYDDEYGADFGDSMNDMDPREEEAEEIGPGGFEPGQAVGPDTQTARKGAVGGGGGKGTKIHRARVLFKQLVNTPDVDRQAIIAEFVSQLGVTDSTAVSYYERLAKEFGMTNTANDEGPEFEQAGMGEDDPFGEEGGGDMMEPEMPQEEIDQQPPDRQGIIRQVDNAHLVYKRQMENGGFEELWSYNISDKLDDALTTRRAILAGTDIPRGHTRSEDGQQSYTLTTMGNAQLLHITGLSN